MYLTLSQKTKTTPPVVAHFITSRYSWLSLDLAEPNLGIPPFDINTTNVYVLSSNEIGVRGWIKPPNKPYKYANSDSQLSIVPILGSNIVENGIINSKDPIAYGSMIAGGESNLISIDYSFIGSGELNKIVATDTDINANTGYNYIGTGILNSIISSTYSFIGTGKENNHVSNVFSFIVNGSNNEITKSYKSSLINGNNNNIEGEKIFLGSGVKNELKGKNIFTGIGKNNVIIGKGNSVVNGKNNNIQSNTTIQELTSFDYSIDENLVPIDIDRSLRSINLYVEKIDNKYYAYIGTPFENASAGKVDIYEVLSNTSLNYISTLDNGEPGSLFGYHIRSNSESKQLYISAPNLDNVGSVYCYDVDTTTNIFSLNQNITTSNANSNSYFGYSFAVSPRTLLVGAPYHNSGKGAAFLFRKNHSNQYEDDQAYVQILNGNSLDNNQNFGFSVDMSYNYSTQEEELSGTLFIGSPNKNVILIPPDPGSGAPEPTPTPTLTPTCTPSITKTPTKTKSVPVTPAATPSLTITPSITVSSTPAPSNTQLKHQVYP